MDRDDPEGPVTMLFAAVPWPSEGNLMQLVAMFIPDGHGSLGYADARALGIARRRMRRLTTAAGAIGTYDSTRTTPWCSRAASPSGRRTRRR